MPSTKGFLLPDSDDHRAVHLQGFHKRKPQLRSPAQQRTLPSKMIRPVLQARIEDRYISIGIRHFHKLPGTFAERAGHTGQRQISCLCSTASRRWNDVVDMKLRLLPSLRQLAILTSPLSSLHDESPQNFRDTHALRRRRHEPFRAHSQERKKLRHFHQFLSLCPLCIREGLPTVLLVEQRLETTLVHRRQVKSRKVIGEFESKLDRFRHR